MRPANDQIVGFLNRVLRNELTAINQYFLHTKMLSEWGLGKLAAVERKESLGEMNHAEWLMERILFLEGLPNLQDLGKLLVGETVKEILECDLAQESSALPELRDAIAFCEQSADFVSRDLFAKVLESEEEHVNWLETQLRLIDQVGLANYVQSQMTTGD